MTFRTLNVAFALTVLIAAATGCAFGQKQSFSNVQVTVSHRGTGTIAVAGQDHRPYVLSGDSPPTYVGTQRGGFGNGFDVTTKSGAPLALEFGEILRRSLSAKGYKVTLVVAGFRRSREQTKTALAQTKASRLILLSVIDWATDTYNGTDLSYNLVLEVMDASGRVLARSSVVGEDRLGSSLFDPQSVAREEAPKALATKLGILINEPKVAAALNDVAPEAAAAAKTD